MKKASLTIAVVVVILGGLVAVLLLRPADSAVPVTETMQTATPEPTIPDEPTTADQLISSLSAGRYTDYNSSAIAATGYTETILFFHASWCPECSAFEQAIKADSIPDGIQIVKVDYDNSDDLRQKYGVTLQSTFVKVGVNGDRISTWVGYGRDKSLTAILENT